LEFVFTGPRDDVTPLNVTVSLRVEDFGRDATWGEKTWPSVEVTLAALFAEVARVETVALGLASTFGETKAVSPESSGLTTGGRGAPLVGEG
jgi:hypothetical protein